MNKWVWIASGFDPRPLVKATLVSVKNGWARAYENNTKYLIPIQLPWWKWQVVKIQAYLNGMDPTKVCFFAQNQFHLGEIEMMLSCIPPNLGPIMINRVQVSVTTNQVSASTA